MARPATAAFRLLSGEREPVRVAATADVDIISGGLIGVDGTMVEAGDRVLLANQADPSQNGIYLAQAGRWLRAADADSARSLQKGTTVSVQQGVVHAGARFRFETFRPNVGSDAIAVIAINDATLTALAAFNSDGFMVQTAPDTFTGRSLVAPAAGIAISNPAGIAGNPGFALANDLAALEGLSATGFAVRTANDSWTQRSLAAGAGIGIANGSGVAGNPTVSLSLLGLEALVDPNADRLAFWDDSAGTVA